MDQKTPTRVSHEDNRTLKDGKLALGICIGFLLSVGAYLLADFFQQGLTREEVLQVLPSLLALIVASTSLVVSFHAFGEQRRMRQAGTDPVVIAHLMPREDEPQMIHLAISNVGAGAAVNVKVSANEPTNAKDKSLIVKVFGDRHPISVILQNQSISYPLQTGVNLLGDDPLKPFEVKIEYRDIEGTEYWATHTIDVLELDSRSAHKSSSGRIADATEKLGKSVQKMATDTSKTHVVMQTQAEHDIEVERRNTEARASYEAMRAKQKGK